MKRLTIAFVFILAVSFAVAMEDPITVKAEAGNYVKLYAWTAGGGPMLTMDKGDVDSEGIFQTTFFSLHENVVALQVMILNEDEVKIKDDKFFNIKTNQGYIIDCKGSNCSIEVDSGDTEADLGTTSSDTELSENSTEESDSDESVTDLETKSSNTSEEGNSMFFSSGGNYIILLYIIGGVLTLIVVIIAALKFRNFKEFLVGLNYFSEEGELVRLRKQIEKKDRLIKRTKEKEEIQKKIKAAKVQLSRENKKLEKILREEIVSEKKTNKNSKKK